MRPRVTVTVLTTTTLVSCGTPLMCPVTSSASIPWFSTPSVLCTSTLQVSLCFTCAITPTIVVTSCAPSASSASQSFLGLSSGGSGQVTWSLPPISAASGVKSLTPSVSYHGSSSTSSGSPSSTLPGGDSGIQPQCPGDSPSRVYVDFMGMLYSIYCDVSDTDSATFH
jgi:hypothetical protein